jgi:hypothetical protein
MILAAAGAADVPAAQQRVAVPVIELRGFVPSSCGTSFPTDRGDEYVELGRLRCSAAVVVRYTQDTAEEAPVRVWVTPL